MSGSLGDMGNLLKQAQLMQKEMDRVREELRTQSVEGASPDGLVTVEISGDRTVRGVVIAPELIATGDVARIQASVLAALKGRHGQGGRRPREVLVERHRRNELAGPLLALAVLPDALARAPSSVRSSFHGLPRPS